MNLLTKCSKHTSLFVFVLLLNFSAKAQEPAFDLIYGQDVKAVYLSNKVKEVFVESDHYYNGSLIHPRFLSHYYLVDKRGLVVQSMSAHNYKLTQRVEYEYSNKGELVLSTLYGRSADVAEIQPGNRQPDTAISKRARKFPAIRHGIRQQGNG
jgi:hypothetical protein